MVEQHNGENQTDADDDLSTTPPNPVNQTNEVKIPSEKWVMPKPVFRRSGGYDPLAVREEFEMFEDTTAVPNKILEEAAELTAARRSDESAGGGSAVVEPQPDVLEIIADPPANSPAVSAEAPKGGAGRIITVLLVILASVAVIAIFLLVVTYLFLSKGGDGSF